MSGAGRKVFAGGRDLTDLTSLAVEAMCDLRHPVKTEVAEWAAEHLGQRDLVTADRESIFSEDDWKACADRGLLGLIVSPTFGGRGQDLITLMLSLEGLGLGCRDNGLVFALASQVLSTQYTIERFGSDEQCRAWLPRLCDGSAIGAFAITEPGSGSNAYAMSTTAEPTADGYVINGHKAYLTLGPRSDVCVVFAATDPAAGSWGISAFLVPMDLPGVQRGPNREKTGMRTTPFGDIVFDDVEVPTSALLGRDGAGATIFSAALNAERGFIFIAQVGAMEWQLDETIDYAQHRKQGGVPIFEHQTVSHRIVDMKLRHETARLLMYKTALAELRGDAVTMDAALSKLMASEHAVSSAFDAVVNHGAVGFLPEFEVERTFRDFVGGVIYSGTSDIQRNIVARLLASDRRRRRATSRRATTS